MLDTKNPYSVFLGMSFVIVLLLSFYTAYFWVTNTHTISEVKTQNEHWKINQPASFSYRIESGCMEVNETIVVVDSGKETYYTKNNKPETIDSLFELAERAVLTADTLHIRYEKTYGFPTMIQVDWNRANYDDECAYEVKDFRATPR